MRRSTAASSSSSSLIAFTPRQVILLDQKHRNLALSEDMAKSRSDENALTNPEDDSLLMYSIALWLQNKGFNKVLKRFLSAAQIQDDNWKDGALDLNDIFAKYQGIGNVTLEDATIPKKRVDGGTQTNGVAEVTVNEESKHVKKKKMKSKVDAAVSDTRTIQNGNPDGSLNESYENKKQDEDFKGSNGLSCSELKSLELKEFDGPGVLEESQSTKKEKAKKKKKLELMPRSLAGDENETNVQEVLDKETQGRIDEAAVDGVVQSKKASKKRKRMAFDGSENRSDNAIAIEESITKKSKGQKECAEDVPIPGGAGYPGKQNENKDSLPVAKSNESKPSRRKDSNSAEPKTVNAFQRVKVDEVKFVDDRLQDNSYWAKAGAENGYGAKAQEVLGQVKGRDFRHEKTKKKRGSYRGGQIDLQSHSIKFNYSDEE